MAPSRSSTPASSLTQAYLFLYNLVSLGLWGTLTFRLFSSLFQIYSGSNGSQSEGIAGLFVYLFPLLRTTQSLATLEILHSLFGLVRASVMTTTMQVASRLLLVWGVIYNTFFILYPVGISSECFLIYLTVVNASGLLAIFRFAFIAILLVYIPGSYILFTHMMVQRRKVMKAEGKKKAL
ncbi:PAS2 [Nannizzia gypsea CBS 118893]|uniref:Very-long-chain (3R)-3-hydroxyacyl-CoA dehydratase n=1 Tax=Arthroderma gypseum (strain ATCC MYA-4604 / CBS 118893) TaxID=535722 RepID=E4UYS1_ARTGP|nr:PAS2 [Nannizzia gypsea CBS 118893]EFR03251.1 PAS2 [Nannizzia gypsea CBS 118893]